MLPHAASPGSMGAVSATEEPLEFGDIMPRIGELADELMSHPDEEVAARVEQILDLVDVFHREGLARLVEMIRAWRGELFLESVERDEIAGTLIASYELGEDEGEAEAPGDT